MVRSTSSTTREKSFSSLVSIPASATLSMMACMAGDMFAILLSACVSDFPPFSPFIIASFIFFNCSGEAPIILAMARAFLGSIPFPISCIFAIFPVLSCLSPFEDLPAFEWVATFCFAPGTSFAILIMMLIICWGAEMMESM